MTSGADGDAPPAGDRRRIGAAALLFLLTFAGAALLFHGRSLYDSDAYYHLAIARQFVEDGVRDARLPLRASLLGPDTFADKEAFFHVLLMPFAWGDGLDAAVDPAAGTRLMHRGAIALALFIAAIVTVIGVLARRAIGPWGLLLGPATVLLSTDLAWRLVRLRAELLSLPLLLIALALAASGRVRWLALVVAVYTLGYTAFHALVGLLGLLFVLWAWRTGRPPWRLALYVALGAAAGLLLHPHFPDNLTLWIVQNVQFFAEKGQLDVGTEIRPLRSDVILMVHLGLIALLVSLVRAAVPASDAPPSDAPGADAPADASGDAAAREIELRYAEAFTLAALIFGALYLLMSRFVLYAVPLTVLATLFQLRARGLRIGAWARLPGRGAVPLALALALALALGAPELVRQHARFLTRTDPGPEQARFVDREQVGAALPAGARVAAPWRQTPIYLLWAPQASYLNVLDPLFMAHGHPTIYDAQRALFDGRDPDPVLTAATVLASDHLAYGVPSQPAALTARLVADPRIAVRHRASNLVAALRPAPDAFVLDWRLVTAATGLPPSRDALAALPRYPRLAAPSGALEGYVDGRRALGGAAASAGQCVAFARAVPPVADGDDRLLTLAPVGPTTVWWNTRVVLRLDASLGAHLDAGVALALPFAEAADPADGADVLTIATCAASPSAASTVVDGAIGFYLLRASS
ncbi:MAG: hypothetical protein AAF772_07420 [Acidobacteriota bacterium]